MNREKTDSMEDFLRKENLKLVIENVTLKNKLKYKDIIITENELEEKFREYYDESNEVVE